MLKTYKIIYVVLLFSLSIGVSGQTNTLSPYSSFGLGDITSHGVGYTRGIGGAGIGLAIPNQINFLNPAAYTSQDTLSFIFDGGLNGNRRKYEATSGSVIRNNIAFSHLGFSFPITRWWVACFGAMPYSSVGYKIKIPVSTYPAPETASYLNEGWGDINRYFIGSGFKWRNLSVGINASYLLGTLEYRNSLIPSDYIKSYIQEESNIFTVRGIYLDLGAQYSVKIDKNSKLTIGAFVENSRKLTASQTTYATRYLSTDADRYNYLDIDTVSAPDTIPGKAFKPAKIGFGLSLILNKRVTLAFDYTTQDWSKFSFPGKISAGNNEASLGQSKMFNFGVQYIPNPTAIRGYLPHVSYQVGGHFGDTYLTLRGQKIKDYGISFGLGLPLKGNRSMVRLNYELGQRGTTDKNLIKETYQIVSFSISLYDFWFIKPKFD